MQNSQLRISTIVGARPQFIKAAVVSRAISNMGFPVTESIVHTGQHHDADMSQVFFDQMGIPEPSAHLGVGGLSHGKMTGRMLEQIEETLVDDQPDVVLVYGDTNSTLAGTLAASKLLIPVIHVEAGLRSFNKRMPEEQNRIVADHLSDLLLCPTETALKNLAAEGLESKALVVGDVMYDASLYYRKRMQIGTIPDLPPEFILVTLHRAETTDNPERLRAVVDAINSFRDMSFILPLHPRTRGALSRHGLQFESHVRILQPVGFLEMIYLESKCAKILTDSGGVQKESYFFQKPCGTLRDETEWVETVHAGANTILGVDKERILKFLRSEWEDIEWPPLYGDGNAGEKIVTALFERFA